MFPAVKLTRKQRNRLAAHRSRQKRQEEHNRLKQRVRELEMVNELLKRENERLISRPGGDAEGLLSSSDRDLIRKLTAPTRSSLATSTVSKESFSADEAQPTSLDGDPYVRRDYSDDDSSPTQDHLLSTANTSRNLTDSATASPTNVTTIETPKAMGDFKPAVLEQTLQKTPSPALVSFRRSILAALMTPKMFSYFRESAQPHSRLTQQQIIRILLGLKKSSGTSFSSTPTTLTLHRKQISSRNRLVEEMFSTTKWPVSVP